MADQEQLKILKQGVEVWNKWRIINPNMPVNLASINLSGMDLQKANLSGCNLRGVNLTNANLVGANFIQAFLFQANLNQADLTRAILREAFLYEVSLNEALLYKTNFSESRARKVNFNGAILDSAIFGYMDLSKADGLDEAFHRNVSTVGTDTLYLSKGKIPDKFLRGCGLSDWEIESAKLYNPELSNEEINQILYRMYEIRAYQPLQISPLFISYSHTDSAFVDSIEVLLNEKGIRFWRDIHAATSGRLEKQIDLAIRHNPTVLVILSENSIKSDWVEHEVRFARQLEKETERDVLCPVALDESWKTSSWPQRIMEQVKEYNILDFSEWNDDDKFKTIFGKLIDGLNLYYK